MAALLRYRALARYGHRTCFALSRRSITNVSDWRSERRQPMSTDALPAVHTPSMLAESPPEEGWTIMRPRKGWVSLQLGELWTYRELLYFFAWRDVKVRYKQTLLGAAWAVLQPVLTMLLFTVVFGHFANIPSEG